jgi:alkylhydroperoxidase family enzyme
MSRITPAEPPYSDALQQRFARVVPEGLRPPRIYRIVARNESLFLELVDRGLLGPTGLFDRRTLPPRLRELLILRTCVAAGNDYEWHLHVDPGLSTYMGLSEAEIANTRADTPEVTLWTSGELAAMELADALVRRLDVDDALYDNLREHYDEPTLIEMTQLIGWYTIVAMHVALAALRPNT